MRRQLKGVRAAGLFTRNDLKTRRGCHCQKRWCFWLAERCVVAQSNILGEAAGKLSAHLSVVDGVSSEDIVERPLARALALLVIDVAGVSAA